MKKIAYTTLTLALWSCATLANKDQNSLSTPKLISSPQLRPKVYKEKERIAVLGLKNKAGVKEAELSYLTEVLRDVASRLPQRRYSVMTEDNILVMLPPNTRIEDCQGSCAVTTGRNLGAHWVLVGNVVRFGSSLRLTVRLHHTKSGELRGSERIKGSALEDLEVPLEKAALKLFSELDGNIEKQEQPSLPQTFPKAKVSENKATKGKNTQDRLEQKQIKADPRSEKKQASNIIRASKKEHYEQSQPVVPVAKEVLNPEPKLSQRKEILRSGIQSKLKSNSQTIKSKPSRQVDILWKPSMLDVMSADGQVRSTDNPVEVLELAEIAYQTKDYESALFLFNRIKDVHKDPKLMDLCLYKIGMIHLKKERYKESIVSFITLINKHPNSSYRRQAFFYIIDNLIGLKKCKAALKAFQTAKMNYKSSKYRKILREKQKMINECKSN